VDGTGPGAARIAARSTWLDRDPGFRIRAGADGEDGQLLVEGVAMAGWTGRLLTGPRQVFEPMTAIATRKLEQGHTAYYEAIGV
jgi:hypothetical protein